MTASTPQIKTYQSQSDFERGKPKGVSINSYGEILLGPPIAEHFNSDLPFLWSLAIDSRGNIFVGGGNSGQVFKIEPSGTSSVCFVAPESQIYALEVDKQNNLYVGTAPEGKVYKVPTGKQLKAEEALFFDPQEVYIWSLVFDSQRNLFVATGNQGKIYKVDTKGNGTLFYDSDEIHIRKMLIDKKGNLIVGTSDKGQIIRIDPAGRAFVYYDSPLVEITGLAVDEDGNIYAAAAGDSRLPAVSAKIGKKKPTSPRQEVDSETDDEDTIILPIQEINVTSPPRLAAQNSALYRIEKDGTIITLWESHKDRIYTITLDNTGKIILGTGEHGRLYSMSAEGERTLMTELDELQITTLGKDTKGQIYLCTSNTGKVYSLAPGFRTKGEYVSEVIDAGVASQWGSISWEKELNENAVLVFYTRSGNTEEPDKTWSPWTEGYTNSAGQLITSPPARFIQFKAILTTKNNKTSPRLKEVNLVYLQKNVAPQILEITMHPPGDYFPESRNHLASNSHLGNDNASKQNRFQNNYIGHKTYKKGFRSLSWRTHDDNGDFLSFDLYYRGEEENSWKTILKDYKGFVYSWDSELLPDGRYLIKVVAKDDLSNPPSFTLTTEKISQFLTVDNTGPVVSGLNVESKGTDADISFKVKDEMTIISSVEFGINAENWKLVYPIDGICDSKSEKFELKINSLIKGSNTIVIKAKDFLGNIGYGKKTFKF